MLNVPNSQREALLALGATRWEVIRHAVLPFSRVGIAGGAILALGRALGETIVVTSVIGNQAAPPSASLFNTGYTLASVIANQFGEATPVFSFWQFWRRVYFCWLSRSSQIFLRAELHRAVGAHACGRAFNMSVQSANDTQNAKLFAPPKGLLHVLCDTGLVRRQWFSQRYSPPLRSSS